MTIRSWVGRGRAAVLARCARRRGDFEASLHRHCKMKFHNRVAPNLLKGLIDAHPQIGQWLAGDV